MNTIIENTVQEKINSWLSDDYDTDTQETIRNMSDEELIDAFYKDLEFGTGGMRGIMGVGTNRINRYTIGASTQGLANYLKKSFPDATEQQPIKVAIAYDSRNSSSELANIVADIFSANGIYVFLFSELRPTPQLSFTIRHLKCHGGVVLTASHNPKEYNGYKVYWQDGGQIIPPHDKNIIAEVKAIKNNREIRFERNHHLVEEISTELDKAYISQLKASLVDAKTHEIIQSQKDLSIVYTSLHGTGITLVPKVLEEFGFKNVHIVEEQATADGDFPTVIYPNPEESEAMTLAIKKAQAVNADIVMATDPDADRVGIAVKDKAGNFILLNGNQTLALLVAYNLESWKNANKLTGKQMVIKTIVTTELVKDIADRYNVASYDTLTGFKYIAGLIEEKKDEEFIVGGEESYGYLIGDTVRDKDGIASCASIALLAAYAKDKGLSLFEWLIEIYKEYGLYVEKLKSLTKKGKTGASEIKHMMQEFRSKPPKELAGEKVVRMLDYQSLEEFFIDRGTVKAIENNRLKSNVLQFYTEAGTKVSMRPSGTEPKIKFYFSLKTHLNNSDDFELKKSELDKKIDTIISEIVK